MTVNRRRRSRRMGSLAIAASAAVLGTASTGWACGVGMGWIKVTSVANGTFSYADSHGQSSTGNALRGATIKVTAGQLKVKPAKYSLMYAPPGSGLDCHTATQMLKSPAGAVLQKMTTNPAGNLDKDLVTVGIQAYKAVIPSTSPTGDAQICAREFYPTLGNTYTGHATFTIG